MRSLEGARLRRSGWSPTFARSSSWTTARRSRTRVLCRQPESRRRGTGSGSSSAPGPCHMGGGVDSPLRGSVVIGRYRGSPPGGSPCRGCRRSTGSACCGDAAGRRRREQPGMLGRGQHQEPRRRPRARALGRERRRSLVAAPVKIGLFLALFPTGRSRRRWTRRRRRLRDGRDHAGSEPACTRRDLADAGQGQIAATTSRSRRSRATQPAPPRRGDRRARGPWAYRGHVRLAAEIGVETVITFSGCPGESEHSLRPSWVMCSWPDDFPETLAWQWANASSLLGSRRPRSRAHMACASRSSRTPASSSTTPRRCCGCARRRADASASTSTPRTSSGSGSTRLPGAGARGAIFHVHAKDTGFDESVWRSTASSRRRRPP